MAIYTKRYCYFFFGVNCETGREVNKVFVLSVLNIKTIYILLFEIFKNYTLARYDATYN